MTILVAVCNECNFFLENLLKPRSSWGNDVLVGFICWVLFVNAERKNAQSTVAKNPELHVVDETCKDLSFLRVGGFGRSSLYVPTVPTRTNHLVMHRAFNMHRASSTRDLAPRRSTEVSRS